MESRIDLNRFAQEVHNNAVEHGWWEGERDDSEVIALIHSELSEALQAARDGDPLVWYQCGTESTNCKCVEENCGVHNDGTCSMGKKSARPEGVAVELVDAVIRILDAAVAWKINIKSNTYYYGADWIEKQSLPWLVSYLHYEMSCVFQSGMYGGKKVEKDKGNVSEHFSRIITAVQVWLAAQNVNFDEVLLAKHEFNKGRPYKHGKKF